ncbi:MAG: DUF2071 domain-containing protein [Deltaproteobacteria bacterium]|nr:DUF2071 domain-containing protein [Deltaproteobacteria bacterium]
MGDPTRTVDRIAPTRRPDAPNAGTQQWRELLFLHWTFPLEVVRPLVPASLELDAWEGRAWVGLVPFAMRAIRSSWMPESAGLDFLETNVRTYVVHDGVPGVWFFSLEASSWLAVRVARLVWNLPYFHASMESAREGDRITYASTRKSDDAPGVKATWEVGEMLGPSREGTLEHFLLERYMLFSATRAGGLRKGQVHHVPYPAQRAKLVGGIEQGLVGAAGLPLDPRTPPETVHYSEGVDVEVFGPWDI